MISAQNHQQQLSGNKTSIFSFYTIFSLVAIFAIVLLASCGSGRTKTPQAEIVTPQGTKVYNPKTGKYEFKTDVTGKVDTVRWSDAGTSVNDPIESDPSQYLDGDEISSEPTEPSDEGATYASYNVAMMIPFNAHKTNDMEGGIHSSSKSALAFYEGAKLAFDKLSSEGVNLNVTVMDTKRSESETLGQLSRSELSNAHLIIGPYGTKPLTKVAEFAKKEKKILVSPVNTSKYITKENPNYIQVNPSLKSHCEAIMEHALKDHSASDIVLVCRDKDVEKARLKFFQDANSSGGTLKEYIIDAETAQQYGELDLLPYFKEGKTTVFIVPSYSNEKFISNFMRQVAISKGPNEAIIYGMPRWLEFKSVSYDYFENLNVHLSVANFANKNDSKIKDFRRKFFEKYGTIPNDNAFKGYDITLFFGRQLYKHGTSLSSKIDVENENYLSTKFEFEKNIPQSAMGNDKFEAVNYIENKFVNIIKFENYHFQKAN